ncbi:MAG: alpha/beta fold hydrolase [Bacteroidetes bacterium]|nr:alpha/beta fold hydrolase [Bacteroidota bacterium]
MMRKILKYVGGIVLFLAIVYLIGPKPSKPVFDTPVPDLPGSLIELETMINTSEKAIRGIKPDNEARIVWADSTRKEKTKIVFLYLHGFTGSFAEGEPVHRNLAKKYNANLYLARLAEHGIDRGDSNLISLTADNYAASAETAYKIAQQLGDEVILIGTSAGGALSLFLASHHPEIKAVVLYAPCIKLYDPAAAVLNKHWGFQIGKLVSGSPVKSFDSESAIHSNYWTLKFRMEGLVALVNLYSATMNQETFSKVKCPVFLGYYYKNEAEQDMTVSVPAMLKMYEELGTPVELRRKMAFPEAKAHVIASYIRSKDWQGVERETDKFFKEIVRL